MKMWGFFFFWGGGCKVDCWLTVCCSLDVIIYPVVLQKLIDLNKIKRSGATNIKCVPFQKDVLHDQVSRTARSSGPSVFPAVYSLHAINTPECEEALLILNKRH